jgi:SAM-dependent methyltransferase
MPCLEPLKPWYESLFDANYLLLFDNLPRLLEAAEAEVEFLHRCLDVPAGSKILDLGCGFGRHAVGLASCGYRVTGLDLSEALLALARRVAKGLGAEVDWQHRDLRDLQGLGPFDACVCLSTVFGYFDDVDNRDVLVRIGQALHDEGQLVLDVFNPLALLQSFGESVERRTDHGLVRETRRYQPLTGRLETDRTFRGYDGRKLDFSASSVRMYTPCEIVELLQAAGFVVQGLFGSLTGEPFEWASSVTQVYLARRAAR